MSATPQSLTGTAPEPNQDVPPLPTFTRTGGSTSKNLDVRAVAATWFRKFVDFIASASKGSYDDNASSEIFLEDVLWRDTLALTWEFRTFNGLPRVGKFLLDILPTADFSNLVLKVGTEKLQHPFPDMAWIEGFFTFSASSHVIGSGVFRIVPTGDGKWKAHTISTDLEGLKGIHERVGEHRPSELGPGQSNRNYASHRREETEFLNEQPVALVIGGGQSGLMTGARLKQLGIPTLIVEKLDRVGDQWRGRYETLWLHDYTYVQSFPYLPYPSSWPEWVSGAQFADWLEIYAKAMELNIWTNSEVISVTQGSVSHNGTTEWTVSVRRGDGSMRTLKPRHVIVALGLYNGVPNIPRFAGDDMFKGQIIHTRDFKSGKEFVGKKVLVIGAATSGHDVAHALHDHGVDVTMYQRSSTYIMSSKNGVPTLFGSLYQNPKIPPDVADRISASYPNKFMYSIHSRAVKHIAYLDRKILDGLLKRGFKLNPAPFGIYKLVLERAGGYYLDSGASQLIIDGKIKLKNDGQIDYFTPTGVRFDDGNELNADVVILATGFGDYRQPTRKIFGDKIADAIDPLWGTNDEGEVYSAGRYSGVPGLYYMMGNIMLCRQFSKSLAYYIKATEEGIIGTRYTTRL